MRSRRRESLFHWVGLEGLGMYGEASSPRLFSGVDYHKRLHYLLLICEIDCKRNVYYLTA